MATTLSRAEQKEWARVTPNQHVGLTVQSKDGKTYVLSIDDAEFACKSLERFKDFGIQIADLLGDLHKWLVARREIVERGYFSIEPSGATLLVVRKGNKYDPDFEDELANLELAIMQNDVYSMIRFRSIALPNCPDETVASFINRSRSWVANLD